MKVSSKYDPGVQVEGDEFLCLHRNENLLVDAEMMASIARELLDRISIPTYPDAKCGRLRGAIASLYGVSEKNVFVGNGADEVLADLLDLLREEYGVLHVLDTHFKVYDLLADRCGYQLCVLPGETFRSGRIRMDREGPSGLSVVDSPNAITSSCLPFEDIAGLYAGSRSFCIWDNVYGEFAGDSIPNIIPRNLAIVRSFSKFWGMASLRIGYCIADADLVQQLLDRKDVFNCNGLAQEMAVAVLQRRERFQAIAGSLLSARSALVEGLRQRGFATHEASGNFVLAHHPAWPAADLQHELLTRRIAVRRFPDSPVSNHIRITVPKLEDLAILTQALDGILEKASSQAGRS